MVAGYIIYDKVYSKSWWFHYRNSYCKMIFCRAGRMSTDLLSLKESLWYCLWLILNYISENIWILNPHLCSLRFHIGRSFEDMVICAFIFCGIISGWSSAMNAWSHSRCSEWITQRLGVNELFKHLSQLAVWFWFHSWQLDHFGSLLLLCLSLISCSNGQLFFL